MVILFLDFFFWGTSILFFIAAVPFYIPAISVQVFQFFPSSPTFVIVRFFDSYHPNMWGDISLWFWFAFLSWLEMLIIFPYACWPFVYLHWRSVCLGPLPFFSFDFLLFIYLFFQVYCGIIHSWWQVHFIIDYLCFCFWVVGVLYIFWILTPYQMYDFQLFSPIP